jgi:hypothetical protein
VLAHDMNGCLWQSSGRGRTATGDIASTSFAVLPVFRLRWLRTLLAVCRLMDFTVRESVPPRFSASLVLVGDDGGLQRSLVTRSRHEK